MKYIRFFKELTIGDIALVGGKNASLGQMISQLAQQNIQVPHGFALTADAYWLHIENNNLLQSMQQAINQLTDYDSQEMLLRASQQVRKMIEDGDLPTQIVHEVVQAYQQLSNEYGQEIIGVAVRSSATAEDLPTASFAGQQETFLNIVGIDSLLYSIKKCMSSLFTPRAIVYRYQKGFDHFKVALSVGVQKMVRSDKASSGVAFSLDTESGFASVVTIESCWGLGESIVQGHITPDLFITHKPTLEKGFCSIIKKQLGSKAQKMVYADQQSDTKVVPTTSSEQSSFSLSDGHIIELSKAVMIIEQAYSRKKGSWCPMDIEWAVDGVDHTLYIVQARPETVWSAWRDSQSKDSNTITQKKYYIRDDKDLKKNIVLQGQSIGKKIVAGVARVITDVSDISCVQEGDIIVTTMTDPDWVPIMKKAAGIITQRGGRTCHAAIVSRELGLSAIVGAQDACSILKTGQQITMDCSRGSVGYVYEGAYVIELKEIHVKKDIQLPIEVLLNIADPSQSFSLADMPVNGVGLARIEFVIANEIGIHPRACTSPELVTDKKSIEAIAYSARAYSGATDFFVNTLAQGIATIAAAFYPKKVIVRLSDFKTNEYRNLIGGTYFETHEENPMLGFRGACRYYHESYAQAFALECAAFKKVREVMGFDNVCIMVPFVRTTDEAARVTQVLRQNGLVRGENNLELIMMYEIPANVTLIEDFSAYFDGFSIGSNDLTQLILGIDRDSETISSLFDERNSAVKKMISQAIVGAHAQGKHIGICGQGPSDYPDFADFLIEQGIDSISLNSDAILDFVQKHQV